MAKEKLNTNNGNEYVGFLKGSKRHGEGKMKYIHENCNYFFNSLDQSEYIGQFKNDRREGYGEVTYSSGDVYKGLWVNDFYLEGELSKPNGKYNRIIVRHSIHRMIYE